MIKLDPEITRQVRAWLDTPAHERDVLAGATLYLRLSRNHALYNSVVRNPKKFLPKLEYELKKYLKIRLDNMTSADVVRLEADVIPRVKEIVGDEPVISSEDEFPDAKRARGRRFDHASLPEEIQKLWDSNAQRYRSIVLLFNELKGMADAMPCDRYEKLVILDELDKTYRSNLAKYDAYGAGDAISPSGTTPSDVEQLGNPEVLADASELSPADAAKKLNAVRKSITTHKKKLSSLTSDSQEAEIIRAKIASAVAIVKKLGGSISEKQSEELASLGVTV